MNYLYTASWHVYIYLLCTCMMKSGFSGSYSYFICPHLAVIFPNIFFSYIGNDESTSNNSMRCCFSSSMLVRKCTRLFEPCNHLKTITAHRTCKYSTKWCSSTCVSRLSDKIWWKNYKKESSCAWIVVSMHN